MKDRLETLLCKLGETRLIPEGPFGLKDYAELRNLISELDKTSSEVGDFKQKSSGKIQQETAASIWECYREISASEKLLSDMAERKKKYPHDPHAQKLKNSFGRGEGLQLGIPMGENSHRLFDVNPNLATAVIKAHIADKKAELAGLNEQARIELEVNTPC